MTTRTTGNMIWVAGDKKKGVSVYKLHYKTPQWRIGLWRNGKLYRTVDYDTREEAMIEAQGYRRGFIKRGRAG